jgi:hypothetical protein
MVFRAVSQAGFSSAEERQRRAGFGRDIMRDIAGYCDVCFWPFADNVPPLHSV